MTTTAPLALEQFLKQPETEPASVDECGEVFQKTMPTGGHAIIQMLLGMVIGPFLRLTPWVRPGQNGAAYLALPDTPVPLWRTSSSLLLTGFPAAANLSQHPSTAH
jgi:Uma2 family endonuclease